MTDDFLSRLREEPPARLAAGLRERLDRIEAEEGATTTGRPMRRLLAGLAAAAAVAIALSVPAVRATAREFLDLFRVQRFAAVPVDPERLERLQAGGIDLKTLVGSQVEFLEEPRDPEPVESAELASALAGVQVRQPTVLPEKAEFQGLLVSHPVAFRVTLDAARIEEAAAVLGVAEPRVPAAWDGATIEVDVPRTVIARYQRGESQFVLMQSAGPEVALPDGVELEELGALGLQMAGLSPVEARLFAARIDWRSTLLVPIPAEGSAFREVEVQGHKGLLVSGRAHPKPAEDGTLRRGAWSAVLLWADEDRVYAASGPGHGLEVLQMAESIE